MQPNGSNGDGKGTIELTALDKDGPLDLSPISEEPEEFITARAIEKEKRITLLHWCRHILAAIVIGSYVLIMLRCYLSDCTMEGQFPDSYIAIVGAIVGFYFGGYANNGNQD